MTNQEEIIDKDPIRAVHEWLQKLERFCNSVDFSGPKWIYCGDVASFGSEEKIGTQLACQRDNMIWTEFSKLLTQWNHVWPNIRDFKIDMETVQAGGNDFIAWGAAVWTSTGFEQSGKSFNRPGRISLVLEKRESKWRAIHTHNSLVPGIPVNTYGPTKNT